MKETQEQRLSRLREAWKVWEERLNSERKIRDGKPRQFVEFSPKQGLQRGGNKSDIHQILRQFWADWDSMGTNEVRLEALIALANTFQKRIKPKKLRKIRAKYNRNKHSLLNIPDCQCATCYYPARVRHHIIPLCVGGINSPLNLILICHACHEAIHPWMKGMPRFSKQTERPEQPTEREQPNGPPEPPEEAWNLGRYRASGYSLPDVEAEEFFR